MIRTRAALAASLALPLLLTACDGDVQSTARTIVLVSIDTARADTVRFDDPKTIPNLAELAQRGVVFDQAVSGTSWTLPTHVQMFTGQPPALHGVNFDDVRIDPRTPLLAELFSEAGWFTAGYFSGWYLVKEYGFDRGFDVYENAMPGGSKFERELREAEKIENLNERGDAQTALWDRADKVSHEAISSPELVKKALDAISRAEDQDLFLFLHFFDPHYDYIPPDDVVERFDPGYTGTIDGRNFYRNPRIFDGQRRINARDLEHIKALYRGEVYFTDRHLGEIFDALEDAGRLDGAFVAVVGDHGEEFFEHGGRGHRNTLYDEQLRVPMLMVPPKGSDFEVGRSVGEQTSLSDVAPTLLEYAGLDRAHCFGTSLVPAMKGEALTERALYSNLRAFPMVKKSDAANITHVFTDVWRRKDLKLIRGWTYHVGREEFRFGDIALYDLAADPLEAKPIVAFGSAANTTVGTLDDPRLGEAWSGIEALKAELRDAHVAQGSAPVEERVSAAASMLANVLGQLGYGPEGEAGTADTGAEASYEVPWELAPPPMLTLDALRAQLEKR